VTSNIEANDLYQTPARSLELELGLGMFNLEVHVLNPNALHFRMQQISDLRSAINNIQTESKLKGDKLQKEVYFPSLRMTLHPSLKLSINLR